MLITIVSVIVDTDGPVAVYCNGRLVWPRRDWQLGARCHGTDPNVFVPEYTRYAHEAARPPSIVRRLCPSCPVRAECLSYGRATRSPGWWGGVFIRYPVPQRELPALSIVEPRACSICGETFVPRRAGVPQLLCSADCRAEAARRREADRRSRVGLTSG